MSVIYRGRPVNLKTIEELAKPYLWLLSLKGEEFSSAAEYIKKTPPQVNTFLRSDIQKIIDEIKAL